MFLCLGIYVKIKLICFSKSILSNLSASSKMRNFNFFKWNPLVFAKWSASLPGVPTTTCGFLLKAIAYDTISNPPTSTAVLKPIFAPKASNYSAICTQSSLVGDITQAKNGYGLSRSFWITGIAKEAVLPEPVSASPMMSLPLRVYGSESAWILVGFLYPIALQASIISEQTPNSSKVKLLYRAEPS